MIKQMVQNVVSKSICHGSSVKPLHLWNPAAPLRITETSLYLADKWLFKHLSSKFNVWKTSVPKYLLSEHFKNTKKNPVVMVFPSKQLKHCSFPNLNQFWNLATIDQKQLWKIQLFKAMMDDLKIFWCFWNCTWSLCMSTDSLGHPLQEFHLVWDSLLPLTLHSFLFLAQTWWFKCFLKVWGRTCLCFVKLFSWLKASLKNKFIVELLLKTCTEKAMIVMIYYHSFCI